MRHETYSDGSSCAFNSFFINVRLVTWSLVSLNGIDVVNPYHFHISIFPIDLLMQLGRYESNSIDL